MVCIPCTWWGSSEITLFNAFVNNDTFIVSQTCWLHSNFWRSLGIAVRWPSCTTGRNGEEAKNTKMSSSRNISRENDSKISVTFMWENSHSLIIGTPTTVRCPLGRALTSASLGSRYPLSSRCLSQRLCHWHWSGGIIPTAVPSLQMVLQWDWLFMVQFFLGDFLHGQTYFYSVAHVFLASYGNQGFPSIWWHLISFLESSTSSIHNGENPICLSGEAATCS